jgi:hypothetical protein
MLTVTGPGRTAICTDYITVNKEKLMCEHFREVNAWKYFKRHYVLNDTSGRKSQSLISHTKVKITTWQHPQNFIKYNKPTSTLLCAS